MEIISTIANELGIKEWQVESTVKMLDEGNTLPFIARYRKEATGELDEEQLRLLSERLTYLRNLAARQEEVIKIIDEQGKLTPELEKAIREATVLQEVEDLYRPYKQKRKTRASVAKERGLEPLADIIWNQEDIDLPVSELAAQYVDPEKGVATAEEALEGAKDIIAERISDDPVIRRSIRELIIQEGRLCSTGKEEMPPVFAMYQQYEEPVQKLPPHRVLALNRGERQEALKVEIEVSLDRILGQLRAMVVRNEQSIFTQLLDETIADGFKRLLGPAVEREIRSMLTENAEEHAIKLFALNLRNLLLQSPVKGLTVMGIDPGYRTGCKVAVVDETGKLLDTVTIYPHQPQEKREEALDILQKLSQKHNVDLIAIGNGTASRETEALAAELIKNYNQSNKGKGKLAYTIVSEAGASVYSASPLAREEFPELDVSMRGAVSIARRIQDPMAELVKIDPKSIGVGLYQHDVDQNRLSDALAGVVESCVNYVGVDLNTASPALLRYVAGLQPSVSKNIVAYREANGKFRRRAELLNVKRLGQTAYTQAAGFLRIADGDDPLDNTSVHPESYEVARQILAKVKYKPEDLNDKSKAADLRKALETLNPESLAAELNAGVPTVRDIIEALGKPGRDPREDLPKPIFRTDVLSIEDLQPGMMLEGTVRNVVDFGAFVDIGVKVDGLVHISEMSERYIKHPTEVVAVGDNVKVRVIGVDLERKRISLSMKPLLTVVH